MSEREVDPRAPLFVIVTVCYGLLLAGGIGWTWARTGHPLPATLPGHAPIAGLLWGAAAGVAVVGATAVLLRTSRSMRWLSAEFRGLLGPVGTGGCLFLAVASGVAEEVFFRGAMQPALGFVVTSVVFGLVHVGPDRRYLAWTGFALAMGFLLGCLLEGTQCLLAPILAHCAVNFLNLLQIMRLDSDSP